MGAVFFFSASRWFAIIAQCVEFSWFFSFSIPLLLICLFVFWSRPLGTRRVESRDDKPLARGRGYMKDPSDTATGG